MNLKSDIKTLALAGIKTLTRHIAIMMNENLYDLSSLPRHLDLILKETSASSAIKVSNLTKSSHHNCHLLFEVQ